MTEAGRELDALIAEKVLGINSRKFVPGAEDGLDKTDYWYFSKDGSHRLIPNYSTDIAAAWKVLEHFRSTGYHAGIDTVREGWRCIIHGAEPFMSSTFTNLHEALAETAPLAICLAALEVLEHDSTTRK